MGSFGMFEIVFGIIALFLLATIALPIWFTYKILSHRIRIETDLEESI